MSSAVETSADSRRVAVAGRRENALSRDYWLRIRPEGERSSWPTPPGSSGFEETLRSGLDEQGYCHLESLLDEDRMGFLARLVSSVRDAGWPAVFAFVYDDFWSLAWEPPIRSVAEAGLGGPVFLAPHLAVHYVPASGKARGWHPHVDGQGLTGRLTTWVPLTDATLTNGCMYVVPRRTPLHGSLERFAQKEATFQDTQRLLQNCQALPAAAGSVLCWGFDLLHWGSVRQDSPAPRVSVAFGWIEASETPLDDELPLLNLDQGLPPFDDRLRFISRAVCAYERFDPALEPFTGLAKELLSTLGQES